MTILRHALVLALLLGFLASVARAEDDVPPFDASDLAIEEEALPEDWEILYEEREGTPGDALEEWVANEARMAGVDEDELYVEIRVIETPEPALATVLVVSLDVDPKGFPDRLEKAAKAKGYTFRELGHETRLLVVAAPATIRSRVIELQVETAVQTVTGLALERYDTGGKMAAIQYAKGALRIEPKSGAPYALLGLIAANDGDWDECLDALQKAFAKDSIIGPRGRLAMRGNAAYGAGLMEKKSKELNAEARDALERAVALSKYANKGDPVQNYRYNLACAHARLGEMEPALFQLEKTLEWWKLHRGPEQLKMFIEKQVLEDEDLEELRKDHRYDRVIARVTGLEDGEEEGGF